MCVLKTYKVGLQPPLPAKGKSRHWGTGRGGGCVILRTIREIRCAQARTQDLGKEGAQPEGGPQPFFQGPSSVASLRAGGGG